ncbi:MAG: Gfo/Idh/MocA family oxidoreductase [Planctomycetota bacterium]
MLGTGRITRRLVADLQATDGVSVSAIASRDRQRATWFAEQYGIATGVAGYANLLQRDDVDGVYIALPPSLHTQWTLAAAAAGKHVLCEKPIATNAADARSMLDACSQQGVRFLDATGWLHHERTAAFRAGLDARRFGTIGHISTAVSFFRPFQSDEHRLDPALGGGCLLDLGWYAFGLPIWVAGLPSRVFASAVMEQGVDLRITAMLWWADGTSGCVSCGYDTASRKWFEVAGSDASLICDDFTRPWPDRPARCWIHRASGEVESESFAGHQEHAMIRFWIGGESLAGHHRRILLTQRVLEAAKASVASRKPVEIEADG